MFSSGSEIIFIVVPILLALVIFFTTKKPWLGIIVSLMLILGYGLIVRQLGEVGRLRGYEAMMLVPLIQAMGGFGLILSLNQIRAKKK